MNIPDEWIQKPIPPEQAARERASMDKARAFWREKQGKPKGQAPRHLVHQDNEVNLELALSAIAVCPTVAHATTLLKENYGVTATPLHLRHLATAHVEELQQLREKIAPKIEQAVATNMLSNVWEATEVENMAIERTREMLEEGRIADPSKVARDIADVKAKNVDKRLALEGRPQKVTEHRNLDEIVRALEGKGVAQRVDAEADAQELPSGDAA